MEKRILIAFALSFLVFTLYLRLVAPPPAPVGPVGDEAGEPAAPGTSEGPGPSESGDRSELAPRPPVRGEAAPRLPTAPSEPAGTAAEAIEADRERRIEIETPLYRAVVSNRGGRLLSFVLKHHVDAQEEPFEMVPRGPSERLGIHPLDVDLEDEGLNEEVRNALFETPSRDLRLAADEQGEVELRWANGRGLEVVKSIGFSGDRYELDVTVSAQQAGVELSKRVLYGPGVGEEARDSRFVQPDKGVIQAGGELRLFSAGDVEETEGAAVGVRMIGVASHYFAALMLPDQGGSYAARLERHTLEVGEAGERTRDFITAGLEAPREAARFILFVGPKDQELLSGLGPGVENVIEYGDWMRYLALPLRSALLWIHDYVGNYGWSIVLLTIGINLLLVPLKHHSYVSMRKMQKLAPQIKRIQERYKKLKPTDPRRQEMNKEVYGLYREHNVSPLSGCLPMLLMIPFFFAFYRLLMVSIELRHAPFVLWIEDLSVYDPYFVLPILMGVSQIAIQKLSPQTSADPVQAKVMMLMPVVFVFILAWAPAGLVLYWFVNNLVSLGQQGITNRWVGPTGEKIGKDSPAASGGGKKKKRGSRHSKKVEAKV